ncbi:MAG: hypothetical protein ACYYKD_10760 [Rhodospirillales bacterium]
MTEISANPARAHGPAPGPDSARRLEDFEAFRRLPHALTLLGMSGVGKTLLSRALHHNDGWFHYSADYRIGTRYLAEDLLDNIKSKIMAMGDPFVADLLRSDSIYINHNITVDNLSPVSTFLGMFGDPAQGGLDKAAFLKRQGLYAEGERQSMIDAPGFIAKAWNIYRCRNFVNDASGSLCEICNPADAADRVIKALAGETLFIYMQSTAENEAAVTARAEDDPKPMFYHPDFITPRLADQPGDGGGVDPKDFARRLFPALLEDRKPRYAALAAKFGVTVPAARILPGGAAPDADGFLQLVFDAAREQAAASPAARAALLAYLKACRAREAARSAG